MTSTRRQTIGLLSLSITAIGWAINWPLIKILLREWPPLFARGLAGVIAALIIAGVAAGRGQPLALPRAVLPRLVGAAFTNVFAWMGFATVAMKFVSVGEGALIIYTMPIWVMLLAWPILGTRPTMREVAGLVLGFAGVALILGANGLSFTPDKMFGFALSLACAVFFAIGSVLNGKPLPLPGYTSVAWQLALGCGAMLVLGIVFEQPNYAAISPLGLACFLYMALVPMGVCYLMWFETLNRLPPLAAATGMLLVPVLAIVAAAAILGEPLGLREISAMALTIGGVALALRRS